MFLEGTSYSLCCRMYRLATVHFVTDAWIDRQTHRTHFICPQSVEGWVDLSGCYIECFLLCPVSLMRVATLTGQMMKKWLGPVLWWHAFYIILITVSNKWRSIRIYYHTKPAEYKYTLYEQYCYQKCYLFYSNFSCLQKGMLLKPPNVAWITQCKHRVWFGCHGEPPLCSTVAAVCSHFLPRQKFVEKERTFWPG